MMPGDIDYDIERMNEAYKRSSVKVSVCAKCGRELNTVTLAPLDAEGAQAYRCADLKCDRFDVLVAGTVTKTRGELSGNPIFQEKPHHA